MTDLTTLGTWTCSPSVNYSVANIRLSHCTARDTGGKMAYGLFSNPTIRTNQLFKDCEGIGYTVAEYGGAIVTAQWKKL